MCTTCPPGLYWSVEIHWSLISFFLTNIFTGEVLLQEGLNESVSDGSAEYEDKNGDESDEETRHSPEVEDDTPIVTPKNFGDHMEARPTQSGIPLQRLVQSVKHVSIVALILFVNVHGICFRPRSVENSKLSRKDGWYTLQIRTP